MFWSEYSAVTLNHRPPKSWSCHTAMKKHVSNENKSLYEDPTAVYMVTTTSLVSVQTPMYSTTRAIQCFCVSVSVCVILYLAHALLKKFSALRKNRSHYANFSQSYNFRSRCGKYGVLQKIHFGIKFSFWEF